MLNKQSVGILLAGGESRRFGRPKAFEPYHGSSYYESSLSALQEHCGKVVIVSHPSFTTSFPSIKRVTVIEDSKAYKGCGPLAGMATVMEQFPTNDWYVTAPCDTPLLKSEIYDILLAHSHTVPTCHAVVPVVQGKLQPLIGLYHKQCLPTIQSLLKKGIYQMRALLDEIETTYVEDETIDRMEKSFANINKPEDIELL